MGRPVGTLIRGIIEIDRNRGLSNSVLTPTAQTSVLCDRRTDRTAEIIRICGKIIQNKNEDITLKLILELQMLYGLRISEVLQIQTTDILPDYSIFVHGAKGSNNRLIRSIYFQDYIKKLYTFPPSPVFFVNRWYVYRWYKKKGIYMKFVSSNKDSVTHFFRHYLIQLQKSEGIGTKDIALNIGHKSVKSTERYER